MKKFVKYSLIGTLLLTAAACNNQKNNDHKLETNPESIEAMVDKDRFVWPDSIENILVVPDSLLVQGDSVLNLMDVYTPKQRELLKLLMTTFIDNVEAKDDSLIFVISREEFIAKGIPEPYYDMLGQNIKDLNSLKGKQLDTDGKTITEIWETGKEEIKTGILEELKEYEKKK